MSKKPKLTPAMQRAYEKAQRAGTVHDLTVWKWTPEYKSYVPIKTAEALVKRGLLRCVGQKPTFTGSPHTFNVYEVVDVSEKG